MQAERWAKVRELFERAVLLDDAARAAYLDAACADDAALRAEVDSLIAADTQATGGRTSIGAAAPDLLKSLQQDDDAVQRARWVGRRLGAWRLLREIGQGGMGAVWLAERDDGEYTQLAAVKLMRAGWDGGDLLRRFRAERQILAALNHPHIARLLDGGVDAEGVPYLVLEYVDGEPIHRYCDLQQLDIEARLQLLLTVSDAVAHAHHRLVVHRDLKPSNILVSRDGQVKLLDFGIAKLLEGDGSREISAVRMFTPDYAAPEQVRGEPMTTGVDVYALGLLLYELLTGCRPYGNLASTPAAYEQAILSQEPLPPSRVIATIDGSYERVAARIGDLDEAKLRRRLRGDLDAIVLKALRKRPEDRYASVDALAADLRRHLAKQPVAARRGHLRYRASRFVQRHALAVSLSALAALSLLAGLGVALWQADIARAERDIAQREAQKSSRALTFLTSVFTMADPSERLGQEVTAVDLLAKGATDIERQFVDDPDVRAALLGALGSANLGLGQAKPARELLSQALVDARRSGDPISVGHALLALGSAVERLGEEGKDEALAREAMALDLPSTPAAEELRARIDLRLAVRALDRSDYAASEPLFVSGLARLVQATGRIDPEVMIPYSALLHSTNRADQAEPLLRKALDQVRRERPEGHTSRAALAAQLATNLSRRGLPEQAEPLLREALQIKLAVYGAEHPSVDTTRHNLARILTDLGRWTDAEQIFRDVLAAQQTRYGSNHQAVAASEAGLARTLLDSGRAEAAEPLWRSAQATAQEEFGVFDSAVGITALGLGRTLLALDRLDEAATSLALAEQVYVKLGNNGTSSLARVRLEQTRVQLAQGTPIANCDNARLALAAFNEPGATQGYAQAVLAECLSAIDQHDAAQSMLNQALTQLRAGRGEQFPERQYAEALATRAQ